MKTAYFKLSNPDYKSEPIEYGFCKKWVTYKISILPAYAIASYTIQGMKTNIDGVISSVESAVNGDTVAIYDVDQLTHMLTPPETTLIINYLGIRDYQCFFPHFENGKLKERAAQFMEEADKTFDEASWLSFVLMAGAVFESYLVDMTGDKKSTFGGLIKKISKNDFFDEDEIKILTEASDARNLVHAGRFEDIYLTRDKAMTVRLALEQFLRKDWCGLKRG